MSRDDSVLYSGLTSASARKVEEKRTQKKDEKVRKRSELVPAADTVMKEIAKERMMLGELLLSIVNPDTPDDKVLERLAAVRLHRDWLDQFENKLKNVLRQPEASDE